MMKRIYTLGLLLSFLLITKGFAYNFQSGGIYYNIEGDNSCALWERGQRFNPNDVFTLGDFDL